MGSKLLKWIKFEICPPLLLTPIQTLTVSINTRVLVLKQEQAGFLKNHRTSDHVFILRTIVDKYNLCSTREMGVNYLHALLTLKRILILYGMVACFLNYEKPESMESFIMSLLNPCIRTVILELNVSIFH